MRTFFTDTDGRPIFLGLTTVFLLRKTAGGKFAGFRARLYLRRRLQDGCLLRGTQQRSPPFRIHAKRLECSI